MEYLSDLVQFLTELGSRWPDLAVGGLIGLIWIAVEKIRDRPISLKTFFVILGVSLFFASFHAWREQYQKFKGVDRSLPKFSAVVETLASADLIRTEDKKKLATAFWVELKVSNTGGSQSDLDRWRIHVTAKDLDFRASPTAIFGTQEFVTNEEKKITLHQGDMIYEKAINPIVNGSFIRGWIYFILPNIDRSALTENHAGITIEFEDINGKTWSTQTRELGHGEGVVEYFPGATQPFGEFTPTQPSPTPNKEASPH
jgi:hypothetical protein